MKLTYRGVTYEYNPPVVTTTESEISGKYRGLDWRFRNRKAAPVQPATLELRYRDVIESAEPAPETTPATRTADDWARTRMMNQHRVIKNRQQSLLSRSAAEVGLKHVSQYWNHIQGKIHPSFRASYERSHVALS